MHGGPMAKNPGESPWERPESKREQGCEQKDQSRPHTRNKTGRKTQWLPDGLHASPEPTGTNGTHRPLDEPRHTHSKGEPGPETSPPRRVTGPERPSWSYGKVNEEAVTALTSRNHARRRRVNHLGPERWVTRKTPNSRPTDV